LIRSLQQTTTVPAGWRNILTVTDIWFDPAWTWSCLRRLWTEPGAGFQQPPVREFLTTTN